MVLIQATFNALLGILVHQVLIEPQNIKKGSDTSTYTMQFLFAYGFGIPIVVLEPLYMIEFLGIQNAGLRMVFLGTAIVNSLRIAEGE